MAITPRVFGAAQLILSEDSGATWSRVGWSVNGVDDIDNAYVDDIFSDRNGGEAGPPVDIQYMGSTIELRFLLVEWEQTEVDKMHNNRTRGGVYGEPATPGGLYFLSNLDIALALQPNGAGAVGQYYPRVVLRNPQEINYATRHSRLLISGTAYKDDSSGVLVSKTIPNPPA